MSTRATLENMKRLDGQHVTAYSPRTGEEYSATPEDYFWMGGVDCLTDNEGGEMILVVKRTVFDDPGAQDPA